MSRWLHGRLESERNAIVTLFEAWGDTDRPHRKLADQGSGVDLVHVAPSPLQRMRLLDSLQAVAGLAAMDTEPDLGICRHRH